jgi:tRNA(Arg) A34 adenosine deaminase TadA
LFALFDCYQVDKPAGESKNKCAMKNDHRFMERAIELGRNSMKQNTGGPFGAVVVLGNKIIGEGKNLVTTQNDPTSHAEINAIRDACRYLGSYSLDGAVLYTSCEPCPMCLGAIFWARIGKVVYAATREDATKIGGFDDDHFYEEISASWEARNIDSGQVLSNKSRELFEAWRKKTDKQLY